MNEIRVVEIDELDFSVFGEVIRLEPGGNGVVASVGDGWRGVFTSDALTDAPGSLGWTTAAALPVTVRTMERHHHTRESLFVQAGPVALPLAPPGGEAPRAGEVVAVVLRPGDLVVLHAGTWHDACHGLERETPYYWFATCDPAISDPWVPIADGPVSVRL